MVNILVTMLMHLIRLAIPPPENDQAMTTINSNSAAMSPADRMQLALQAAVSAGTVKSTDQSTLSNALTTIDTSLQSGSPPAPGTDPTSIKTKVNSLIDDQVSSGTLTDDQATELKQVFAQATAKMGGHGGHHHMHVGGGSASPADPNDPTASTNPIDALFSDLTSAIDGVLGTSSTTAVASTTGTGSATSATAATGTSADSLTASVDQLVSFLKQVEQKIAGNYTATGTTAASATTDPVLVDANV